MNQLIAPEEKKDGLKLSLCLIAKNEEFHLPKLLESIKTFVDEIILVDTGSTDRTKEIGEKFGASVFDFEWNNDFSAARNHAIDQATGDWVLILDPDEIIAERDGPALRELIHKDQKNTYLFITRNYINRPSIQDWIPCKEEYPKEEEGMQGYIISYKVRLFPNNPELRFQFAVHEMISVSDCVEKGYKVFQAPFHIHHYGNVETNPKYMEKQKLYLELGLKKVQEEPDNPQANFELGKQLAILGVYGKAAVFYAKCLELDPNHKQGNLRFGKLLTTLGYFEKAKPFLEASLKTGDNKAESHFALGHWCQKQRLWKESISYLEESIKLDYKVPRPIQFLGKAYFQLNELGKASQLFLEAIKREENDFESHFLLGAIFFQTRQFEQAGFALAQSLELNPDNFKASSILGATLLALNRKDEAIVQFERVLQSQPENVDALSNLGVMYAQKSDLEKARGLFEKAHSLQPENEAVIKNFEAIKKELGQAKLQAQGGVKKE